MQAARTEAKPIKARRLLQANVTSKLTEPKRLTEKRADRVTVQ